MKIAIVRWIKKTFILLSQIKEMEQTQRVLRRVVRLPHRRGPPRPGPAARRLKRPNQYHEEHPPLAAQRRERRQEVPRASAEAVLRWSFHEFAGEFVVFRRLWREEMWEGVWWAAGVLRRSARREGGALLGAVGRGQKDGVGEGYGGLRRPVPACW